MGWSKPNEDFRADIADWHAAKAADAYALWSRLKIDGIEKETALRDYIRHVRIAKTMWRA